MANGYIKYLRKNNGDVILPKTSVKAIFDAEGKSIDESINDLKTDVTNMQSTVIEAKELAESANTTASEAVNSIGENGINIYNHVKSGTTHTLTGTGNNAKIVTVADWNPGDTLVVNGLPAYPYNQLAENIANETIFKAEVVIPCFIEKVGEAYNVFFKLGGGLSDSKLALATATDPQVVLADKTYYAGDKELKTGTMPNKSGATQQTGPMVLDDTNQRLLMPIPSSGVGYYDSTSKVYGTYEGVRNVIGLTADKLVKGETVLGITGTAETMQRVTFNKVNSWTPFGDNPSITVSGNNLTIKTTKSGSYSGATLETPIDVTDLDLIMVKISDAGGSLGSGYHSYVTVFDTIYTSYQGSTEIKNNGGQTVTGAGTYIIPVTNLTGTYYLYVQTGYALDAYFTISDIKMV